MQSNAMDDKSNRIHSSKERLNSSNTHQRISTSLESQSMSNAMITRNVKVKCSRKHNTSRSMKVMGVNLKGQFRFFMWCDKPSVMNFGGSTEKIP